MSTKKYEVEFVGCNEANCIWNLVLAGQNACTKQTDGITCDFLCPSFVDEMYADLFENIGKRVTKCFANGKERVTNRKPFKSGEMINTVKGIIEHPHLHIAAYTFVEDDSYVECRRCKVLPDDICL